MAATADSLLHGWEKFLDPVNAVFVINNGANINGAAFGTAHLSTTSFIALTLKFP